MPIDKSIDNSAITPEIKALTKLCLADNVIEPEMYVKYAVNRGLRDLNGNGVLTGLTEISEIQSSKMVDGEKVPCEGKLFYRGVDVEQIVSGFIREKRYGFEETVICFCLARCRMRHSWMILRSCWRATARCPRISCATSSSRRPTPT